MTSEGIVIYPERGLPRKLKARKEMDVYIRKIEPGKGKHADKAGAIAYSREPNGPIVGTVGTGFSDEFRRFLAENADDLEGRRMRVFYQDEYPSGALRAPVFIALHEDYPTKNEKRAGLEVLPEDDPYWLRAVYWLQSIRRQQKKTASQSSGDSSWLDIPVFELPTLATTGMERLIGGPTPLTNMLVNSLVSYALTRGLGHVGRWLFPDTLHEAFPHRLGVVGGLLSAALSGFRHAMPNVQEKGWKGLTEPSPLQELLLENYMKKWGGLPLPEQLDAYAEDMYGIRVQSDIPESTLKAALQKLAAGFDVDEWGKHVLDDKYLSPWEKTMMVTVPLTTSIRRNSDWVTVGDVARVTANMHLGDLFGRMIGSVATPFLALPKEKRRELKETGRFAGLVRGILRPVQEVAYRESLYGKVRDTLHV